MLIPTITFGQKITVSGTVKELDNGEPLPFVNVFVNGTTFGTQTDTLGKFSLTFSLTQKAELVFTSVGYRSKSVFIEVGTTTKFINVQLQSQVEALQELTVSGKKDKEWSRNFERFKRSFLGTDAFAKQTEINNYWVVDFTKEKSLLTASSGKPLNITNESLGYEVLTELVEFKGTSGITNYVVKSFYKEIAVEENKLAKRNELREKAYNGSLRHFLISLAQNKLKENGFDLFLLEGNTIKRGSSFGEYTTTKYGKGFFDFPAAKRDADSSFSFAQEATFIILNRNKSAGPQLLFKDISSATSLLHISSRHRIDKNGNIDQPLALQISGDMDTYRFARTLPTDYQPGEFKTESVLQNANSDGFNLGTLKTLTNKDIFVPGERLHFSSIQEGQGFTDFQPLNVCLYDSVGKKVTHQYFRFFDRKSSGYMLLDKQLPAGQYYLRFFTNWMAAYPELINIQPVFVSKGKLPDTVKTCSVSRVADLDKSLFGELEVSREVVNDSVQKITVFNIPPQVENLTVSVTSSKSLFSFADSEIPKNRNKFITVNEAKIKQLENSDSLLVISGKLINKANKKPLKKYNLTLASFGLENKFFSETQTDKDGKFYFTGINFSGEQTVVYQLTDKRGREVTYGEVLLDEPEQGEIKLGCKTYPLLNATIDFTTSDRFVADDTLSTLLEEVQVLANVISREEREKLGNGISKKTFTDDSPRYTSIIEMLEQLATVQYSSSTGKLMVRNNFYDEPLVLLNDIAINNPNDPNKQNTGIREPLKDRLDQFSPNDVLSVEVLKADESSLYGIRAAGGVIKITLKKGFITGKSGKPVAGTLQISGFTPTTVDVFTGSKTLYWNPEINSSQVIDGEFTFHLKNDENTDATIRLMGKLFDGKVFLTQPKIQ
ncbi:MAG: hypothetical protein ACJAZY_000668 [Spirosomataceae bacterium]